jgi:hypothetical protein
MKIAPNENRLRKKIALIIAFTLAPALLSCDGGTTFSGLLKNLRETSEPSIGKINISLGEKIVCLYSQKSISCELISSEKPEKPSEETSIEADVSVQGNWPDGIRRLHAWNSLAFVLSKSGRKVSLGTQAESGNSNTIGFLRDQTMSNAHEWGLACTATLDGRTSTSAISCIADQFSKPMDVLSTSTFRIARSSLTVGAQHFCVLTEQGQPKCEIVQPEGSQRDTRRPTIREMMGDAGQASPPNPIHFTEITAGAAHTCGLLQDGSVRCWGAGSKQATNRQLELRDKYFDAAEKSGRSNMVFEYNSPTGIPIHYGQSEPPETEFNTISAGNFFTCGLTRSRSVRCWGRLKIDTAKDVRPHAQYTSMDASGDTACAITSRGNVDCWGKLKSTVESADFEL